MTGKVRSRGGREASLQHSQRSGQWSDRYLEISVPISSDRRGRPETMQVITELIVRMAIGESALGGTRVFKEHPTP